LEILAPGKKVGGGKGQNPGKGGSQKSDGPERGKKGTVRGLPRLGGKKIGKGKWGERHRAKHTKGSTFRRETTHKRAHEETSNKG